MISEDKRKHERIHSLNLSYVCLDEEKNIIKQGMGRTLNLSESGLLLETHFPIESRHIVLMTIGLEEELLDISGKPIHIKANEDGTYEIGIEFFDVTEDKTLVLKRFIELTGIQKKSAADEQD